MTTATPSVLIVDDEEAIVSAITTLVRVESEYVPLGFTEPKEALEYLERNSVGIVLADYLMPGMDGIAFLSRVRQLQPEVSRVLVTGHADKESAVRAINELGLFHYLEKPWENEHLRLVIQNGIERTQLLRHLQQKISELDLAHAHLKSVQRRLLQAFL